MREVLGIIGLFALLFIASAIDGITASLPPVILGALGIISFALIAGFFYTVIRIITKGN